MGQCGAKNSVGVIDSINLVENSKNKNSTVRKENSYARNDLNKRVENDTIQNLNLQDFNFENVRILISYCWSDKEISHALADKFVKEKFNVKMDRDRTSSEDLLLEMHNSDFVLLFISKSYLSCSQCLREARYAFENYSQIIVVNLNSNYAIDKWIAQIIGGRNRALLMDSANFCSSYESIKENIIKVVQKNLIDKQKLMIRMPDEKEIAKRKLIYDEYKNSLIQKDKAKVEESKQHIDQVFEVSQNNYKKNANLSETPGILNWILKYPTITIKNIIPFSPNGDINHALFEIPTDHWPKRIYHFGYRETDKIVRKKRPNACRLEFETALNKKVVTKELKEDATHIYFAKLIERHSSLDTGLPKGKTAWSEITGFIGTELKTKKEIKRRMRLDTDLSIHKKTRQKLFKYFEKSYHLSEHAEPDSFEKFAVRMKQNIIDFEQFCLKSK